MIEMPKTIKAGPVTYAVTSNAADWVDVIVNKDEPRGMVGITDHQNARISIKPFVARDVERVTVMHEALHAMLGSAIGQPRLDKLGEDADAAEECLVSMLEAPLLALLRDNPDLVAYLTNKPADIPTSLQVRDA